METCDNCRVAIECEDDIYYCVVCGATVCGSCISDDLDICNDCVE